MGLGLGNCCCTVWPPVGPPLPPVDSCDYEVFCADAEDTATEFAIWLQYGEEDDVCYTCDACDTTPFQLVLERGELSGYASCILTLGAFNDTDFGTLCTGDTQATISDWMSNIAPDPNCGIGIWCGSMVSYRECTRIDPECSDYATTTTSTYVYAMLIVWKDGHGKLLLLINHVSNESGARAEYVQTYDLDPLTCCGLTDLTEGPYSYSCSDGTLLPKCPISIPPTTPGHPEYQQIEMICPP